MTITFFIPGAPTETFVPYEDEPDYTEERPVKPYTEVNMANSNAVAILRVIAPFADDPFGGKWEGAVLDTVIKNTMKALNLNPEGLVTPTLREGNMITFGRDMDYVTRRLSDMLELLTVARTYGHPVCYG